MTKLDWVSYKESQHNLADYFKTLVLGVAGIWSHKLLDLTVVNKVVETFTSNKGSSCRTFNDLFRCDEWQHSLNWWPAVGFTVWQMCQMISCWDFNVTITKGTSDRHMSQRDDWSKATTRGLFMQGICALISVSVTHASARPFIHPPGVPQCLFRWQQSCTDQQQLICCYYLGGIASSMCKPHCWIPRSWLCYPSDKVWTEAEPRPVAPVATLSSPLQLCHLDEQRYCQDRNIPRVCLKPQISVISEQHNLTTDCYWLIGCENKDNQTRCFIYTIIQRYSSTLSSHQCLCWYFTYL